MNAASQVAQGIFIVALLLYRGIVVSRCMYCRVGHQATTVTFPVNGAADEQAKLVARRDRAESSSSEVEERHPNHTPSQQIDLKRLIVRSNMQHPPSYNNHPAVPFYEKLAHPPLLNASRRSAPTPIFPVSAATQRPRAWH